MKRNFYEQPLILKDYHEKLLKLCYRFTITGVEEYVTFW